MLTYLQQQLRKRQVQDGFTIVELLIVVVVIAILAAIAIVSYNGIIHRAHITELQSEAQTLAKQIAIDYVSRGSYPGTASSFNGGAGLKYSPDLTVEYTSNAGTSYCMTVSSVKANVSVMYDLTTGNPVEGVCPGHVGLGGGAPSTVWTAVSAGGARACGISAGQVYCWGSGYASAPSLVEGALSGRTATKISVGQSNICAVANGAAYCWGSNSNGEVGNSTSSPANLPTAVTTTGVLSGKTIQDISVGGNFACALTADNVMACWGNNTNGQLGTYNTTSRNYPVPLAYTDGSGWNSQLSGRTITAITTGYSHTCAIASGAAYCWGSNDRSQLGANGTFGSLVPIAVTNSGVLNGLTISKLKAGYAHTCAVATNSRVYCWQTLQYGSTLNGTNATSNVPVAVNTSGVLNGKNIVDTSGSSTNNCVIDTAGKAYCWGGNSAGQMGNGSTTDNFLPVSVNDTGALSGKTISQISTANAYSDGFTCALAGTEIFCWGANSSGQLGDGTTTGRTTPVKVAEPQVVDL